MTERRELVAVGVTTSALVVLYVAGVVPGVVSDALQIVAPAVAFLSCWSASSQPGRRSAGWRLLGVGAACWAVGQVIFTVYGVADHDVVPVPSAADLGYLAFPVLAVAGVVRIAGGVSRSYVTRLALDGAVVAASLLVISWSLGLRQLWSSGGSVAELVVTTAYPVGDVMLLAVVLLTLSRGARTDRRSLLLLAAGLLLFAVADAAYVLSTAAGGYQSGGVVDLGWMLGFVAIGLSARAWAQRGRGGARTRTRTLIPGTVEIFLPYAPLVAALGVVVVRLARQDVFSGTDVTLCVVLFLLVMSRQCVALLDHRELLIQLDAGRAEAHRRSLHDVLTGLPNRAMFVDRLQERLSAAEASDVCVLFCDVDGFKGINDLYGHSVGDAVLRLLGRRFAGAAAFGETVARLGGDEFAAVVTGSARAHELAEHLALLTRSPVHTDDVVVSVSMSVGMASSQELGSRDLDLLLVSADRAMYEVKFGARRQARAAEPAAAQSSSRTDQRLVPLTGVIGGLVGRTTDRSSPVDG